MSCKLKKIVGSLGTTFLTKARMRWKFGEFFDGLGAFEVQQVEG
jgi:hypothetical protein